MPISPSLIPAYTTCEYLLVLQPHEDLCNRIMQVKKTFAATYDCKTALGGKPNITLVRFTQYEMMEEKILNRIKNITAAVTPFSVELKDYGSFPTHTIYINVATKMAIIELVKQLRDVQRMMKLDNEHKPHFITDPWLVVARKLLPWQYEKGWLEYSNSYFTGMFIADHVLVLKKRMGEPGYRVVKRFALLNERTETRQPQLF